MADFLELFDDVDHRPAAPAVGVEPVAAAVAAPAAAATAQHVQVAADPPQVQDPQPLQQLPRSQTQGIKAAHMRASKAAIRAQAVLADQAACIEEFANQALASGAACRKVHLRRRPDGTLIIAGAQGSRARAAGARRVARLLTQHRRTVRGSLALLRKGFATSLGRFSADRMLEVASIGITQRQTLAKVFKCSCRTVRNVLQFVAHVALRSQHVVAMRGLSSLHAKPSWVASFLMRDENG